jgi:hypothetical protein
MADCQTNRMKISVGSEWHAPIWFGGWVFTIGYLKLAFWKSVFAIIIWPYYLGVHFR